MSTQKIIRTINGREKATGWQARVRVYLPLPNGQPASELTPIKKNFLFADGFNKAHADAWEAAQLVERERIERARRSGRPLPSTAMRRRVEELAHFYLNSHEFTSLGAKTRTRVQVILRDFLKWNAEFGRPYADLWTRELANERLKAIWATYKGKGRTLHAGYEKKIFAMELDRLDRSIERNPFPPIKQVKIKGSLTRPRAFTKEELAAFLQHSSPYIAALWNLLANTGLREQEYHTLMIERVTMKNGSPVEIVIESHEETTKAGESYEFDPKNKRDRSIPLNQSARESMKYLLAHADNSGYVIRRSLSDKSHGYLRAFYATKRRVIAAHPHMKAALSGTTPRTRTTPHTFRKTFATNLLSEGVYPKTVANLLGDDMNTVLNYYAAVLDQDHIDAVHKLDHSDQHLEHSLEALTKAHGFQPIMDLLAKRGIALTPGSFANVARPSANT